MPTRLFCALLFVLTTANAQNAAITHDPVLDKANPASFDTFQLPSHGALLNAFIYVAAGPGPHPNVVLLHGFPGNERNLDLAQSLRRAGWNVMYFDYRGSWGSPGDFSFTHCIEDAQSAISYFRDPPHAAKLHSDPNAIVLVGHSMGGFVALETAALDPAIRAVVTISAADMGSSRLGSIPPGKQDEATKQLAASLAREGMSPLAGTSPEALAHEVLANAAQWNFLRIAPMLATRPLLVITSDDGLAPVNHALVQAVEKSGGRKATEVHMPTDHAYSDHRIELQETVLSQLNGK